LERCSARFLSRYVVAPGHHVPGTDKVVLEKRDYEVIEAAA